MGEQRQCDGPIVMGVDLLARNGQQEAEQLENIDFAVSVETLIGACQINAGEFQIRRDGDFRAGEDDRRCRLAILFQQRLQLTHFLVGLPGKALQRLVQQQLEILLQVKQRPLTQKRQQLIMHQGYLRKIKCIESLIPFLAGKRLLLGGCPFQYQLSRRANRDD